MVPRYGSLHFDKSPRLQYLHLAPVMFLSNLYQRKFCTVIRTRTLARPADLRLGTCSHTAKSSAEISSDSVGGTTPGSTMVLHADQIFPSFSN